MENEDKDIKNMSDHDLLITMHEQIKGIKGDIKDLKDGTATTLSDHENRIRAQEALDLKNKAPDYEKRIRRLEFWCAVLFGLGYALQFYLNYVK